MQTNITDIYACGDCAEYQEINYAIWPQAVEEGKTAGAQAAGENITYEHVPAALSFHGMNTALFAAGDTGKIQISYTKQPNSKIPGKNNTKNITSSTTDCAESSSSAIQAEWQK